MSIAQSTTSVAESLASLPDSDQQRLISSLSDTEAEALLSDWQFWARPKQLAPAGDWRIWLLMAGRGFGKTRTIAEWARGQAERHPGSRGAIVAATAADARDVVTEGESGIIAVCPPWFRPVYEPSKRRITWPNGSMATLYTADEPARLRGPQHHWAVADELAHWRYMEAWDMLMFGLRLGDDPRCVVATTPRPIPVIKDLAADEATVVTRGSTYENRGNLAAPFFAQIVSRYEGTRLGKQELYGDILDDDPRALWSRVLLDETRVTSTPDLYRVVVAIDPAASSGTTGIIVVGVGRLNGETHGYVIDDITTPEGAKPDEWGRAAVAAYNKHKASAIVAEVNNGGDMVEAVIRNIEGGGSVRYKTVRATRGKYTRAEPVSALFEQGRGHMLGYFSLLEDQLCSWVPGDDSPDRLDAMVWGFAEIVDHQKPAGGTVHVADTSGLKAGRGRRQPWQQ